MHHARAAPMALKDASRVSGMAKNKRSGKRIRVCRFCKVDSLLRLVLSWIRVFPSGFPQQFGDFIAIPL